MARTGVVLAVVVTGVLLAVGLITIGSLQPAIEAIDLGTAGNATRTTVFANVYQGINILAIALIVMAAMTIVGVVSAFSGGSSGGI